MIHVAHHLQEAELALLERLRRSRSGPGPAASPSLSFGDRVADRVAAAVGSWPFIIVQTAVLIVWMVLNVTAYVRHWDPYPFILLNLALSFQAAYSAPFIMMSQNRQAAIDRADARHDYDVNVKAELEIELLHQKLDLLRETEMAKLVEIVGELTQEIRRRGSPEGEGSTASAPGP
jgi:uncharacterized membrane protein